MELMDYYTYLMDECADPRTKDWFLVQSPVPLVTILVTYCYFVFVSGPNYMKNKEPYSFKTFLKFYNSFQIIVNAYIVYSTATSGWLDFGFGCEPLNTSSTGDGYNMAVTVWTVFMVKLVDLVETIVFTLRKKSRQVSFLHVYHHITTAIMTWVFAKWLPGGGLALIMIVNSSVHVLMYSYYLLSTGGSAARRLLSSLKPWITVIQMTQFVVLLIHSLQFLAPSCDTPLAISIITVGDLVINLCMFSSFYRTNYCTKVSSVKGE